MIDQLEESPLDRRRMDSVNDLLTALGYLALAKIDERHMSITQSAIQVVFSKLVGRPDKDLRDFSDSGIKETFDTGFCVIEVLYLLLSVEPTQNRKCSSWFEVGL